MTTERIKFENAIQDMQLPVARRSGTHTNARWFLRHGVAMNRAHPKILLAICHAQRITQHQAVLKPVVSGTWRNWQTRQA
ncbi:MAG: hypothetical protein PVG66_02610 [Chromatiales bacterium]